MYMPPGSTVGFYHIFLVSLCYETDYLVYICVFSHYCAMLGYVTFIEVTFMLGCPHSCIISHPPPSSTNRSLFILY